MLETGQVVLRSGSVATAAIGLGQAKFRGEVKWVESQRGGKFGNSSWILVQLSVDRAKKIVRVGIVRVDFRNVFESCGGVFRFANALFKQAEVVPGVWIGGMSGRDFSENCPGFVGSLQIQQSDPLIEARNITCGIRSGGMLEGFQRVGRTLLVHVGYAEIIAAEFASAINHATLKKAEH